MSIAIAVHGRFHAFHLAQALHNAQQDVTLYTNYPPFLLRRFDLGSLPTCSFGLHWGFEQGLRRTLGRIAPSDYSQVLNPLFGRWLLNSFRQRHFDIIHMFSGIAEEVLEHKHKLCSTAQIVRGSSHIRYQNRLLQEEEERSQITLERPSAWTIRREESEYNLADNIVVLSQFAKTTFIQEGIPEEKIHIVPLGVRHDHFTASEQEIQSRIERIRSGQPLRILQTGLITHRKGLLDLCSIIKSLPTQHFTFTLVGDITQDARKRFQSIADQVNYINRVFEYKLKEIYSKHDIFILPTIEDGYAAVLAQAITNGLPVITTTNCSGSDIITDATNGWIVPIRSPQHFIDRLMWCHNNRQILAEMIQHSRQRSAIPSWTDTASQFLTTTPLLRSL